MGCVSPEEDGIGDGIIMRRRRLGRRILLKNEVDKPLSREGCDLFCDNCLFIGEKL